MDKLETDINLKHIDRFFDTHKAVGKEMFCVEAGFSSQLLRQIIKSKRTLTKDIWIKIKTVMKKYGYDAD